MQKYAKTIILSLICLALLYAIGSGCKKGSSNNPIIKKSLTGDTLVVNLGSPAADGCGWAIIINSQYYSPDNLPEEFKIDSLRVNIDYKSLNTKYQCGLNPNSGLPAIHLNTITRKYPIEY